MTAPTSAAGVGPPRVVGLAHPQATDAALTGAKAANLAVCARGGLPTLPGFVLTTVGVAAADHAELLAARERLVGQEGEPLVVRSSSTAEDLEHSSMAGQFVSVLDVRGPEAFLDAVATVVRSADVAPGADGEVRPIAVLVQPQLDLVVGGVLFGVDPVTGDRDHVVVEAVPARVDDLVSGAVTAAHYVLSPRGRVVDRSRADAAPPLGRAVRRRLARLAAEAAEVLGPAQDVEWALDADGRVWLLQSRPVTAIAARQASRRVYGPGPVAETFPTPLRRLEQELWVEPLRDGVERALRASGAVPDRELDEAPIVLTVDGWAAMDLELTGIASGSWTLRRRLNPVQIIRRLGTAWRVGRLRVALPRLVEDLLADVDADLAAVPPPSSLDASTLVELIERGRRELATVHQYEVLAGMLLRKESDAVPASLLALEALSQARRHEVADAEAIERWPVLLTLSPPSLSPPTLPAAATPTDHATLDVAVLDEREGLRLRGRWLQELLAVAARSLAIRLESDGTLPKATLVRELTLAELATAVDAGRVPEDLVARAAEPDGAPLPAHFRMTASGGVLPVDVPEGPTAGLPASAGRAVGTVRHRVEPGAPRGEVVLVTEHLDPALAPVLPSVAAVVAETGSALSHLAILARETGVPAVVGVTDARRRFAPGTRVLVDGGRGDVRELPEKPAGAHGSSDSDPGADVSRPTRPREEVSP